MFSDIVSALELLGSSKSSLLSTKFKLCLNILSKFMSEQIILGSNNEVISLRLSSNDASTPQTSAPSQIKSFFKDITNSKIYSEETPQHTLELICSEAERFIISQDHTLANSAELLHFLVQTLYDGFVYDFLQ